MDEEEIWNSTQRLYNILEATKRFSRNERNQPRKIREVWGDVFEVDSGDTIAIYHNLTLLSQALDWTKTELEKANLRRKQIYTRNLGRVQSALNIGNLDSNWQAIENQLTEETMADLLHCADRLAENESESDLSSEELNGLLSELDALTELFSDADLDEELRIAILDLLETSRQMLSDYRIRGGDVLKEIIELSLGKLMTKRSKLTESKKNGKIAKLLTWLKKIDGFYGRLRKYDSLLQGASQVLLETTKDG